MFEAQRPANRACLEATEVAREVQQEVGHFLVADVLLNEGHEVQRIGHGIGSHPGERHAAGRGVAHVLRAERDGDVLSIERALFLLRRIVFCIGKRGIPVYGAAAQLEFAVNAARHDNRIDALVEDTRSRLDWATAREDHTVDVHVNAERVGRMVGTPGQVVQNLA